jgi:hypothetical protein
VGQTFVSQNAGLNGVEFYLIPEADLKGEFQIHLRPLPSNSDDILTFTLTDEFLENEGFYNFDFRPQPDSFRKYYYVFLEFRGEGNLWLASAPGNEYLEGALYVNHQAQNRNLSFNLNYQSGYAFLDFGREVLYWGYLSSVAIFLFVVPGLSIVSWMSPRWKIQNWYSKVIIGIGLSLGTYPVLYLLSNLVGLKPAATLAWIPGALGSIILVLQAYLRLKLTSLPEKIRTWLKSDQLIPDLMTILVVALIIFSRFFITRVVDLPMWGDSLTHSMVSQLIVDNGGLFSSWTPYAELESFTYHFGFHTQVAVFHWITNIPVPQATMWMGQIINIFAVLGLFPIAKLLGRSKWAGVAALIVAGLMISMPNFYTNWGRYTQLAGQAVLPAVFLFANQLREENKINITSAITMGWIMGGLGLIHYRVLIFGIVLILVLISDQIVRTRAIKVIFNFAIATLLGMTIFMTWFTRLLGGKWLTNAVELASTPASSASPWIQSYNAIGDVYVYLPLFVWILLLVSAVWGIIKRSKLALVILIWWALLLLLANPHLIGLPGQGILSNFAVFIAMYIPAAVMIGGALGWLLALQPKLKWIYLVLLVLVATLGALSRFNDLAPQKHSLASRPDIHAWAWITENTPPSAKFLTNAFFAYGGNLVVGSDGGWWLPLMTQRRSNLPPISYGTEKGARPDNIRWQNEFVEQLQILGIDSENAVELILEREITHIYIGQQQGSVNSFGSIIFDPDLLNSSPLFEPVYHQDRVWIFEVIR